MAETFHGVDIDGLLNIRGRKGYGVSVAVADGDSIETYCSGSGRFGQDFPVVPDMLFQAASVSKPMFALTLLRYVDKGIIDLDADISPIVPEYVKMPLTFPALLSHTAGFNVHGFLGYPADTPEMSLEDVLDGRGNSPRVRRIRPYGKQYRYSGGGITIAELAFTRMTGTALRDAFQREVAEPLGLTRTGYFQPLDDDFAGNAAFGGRLCLKEVPDRGWHYYPEHAAAGLWTTPSELCRIGIALSRSCRDGGILNKETARRMMTPVMKDYGLCLRSLNSEEREEEVAGHSGWNEGFLTSWTFSRTRDFCVALMYNRSAVKPNIELDNINIALFRAGKEK